MKQIRAKGIVLSVAALLIINSASGWGRTGHSIVAQIAMHFLSDPARQKVRFYLGAMSIEDAANWMDSIRSDPDYDFMKPWHYLDFDKGLFYSRPPTDDNILTRLSLTFNELRHYMLLCNEQIKNDLLFIFHLTGDLHQPLHTGYSEDKGGNTVAVDYLQDHTTLHKVWDEVLIDSNNITMDSCLLLLKDISPEQLQKIKEINFVSWYNESRSLLERVYDYPEFTLGQRYIDKNTVTIKERLLYAGIRLAAMLDALFTIPETEIVQPAPLVNSISAAEAKNYISKKVTVCTKVFSVKSLGNVTFMDVGAPFPNNPLTLVIFKKDRAAFTPSPEVLYTGKYICVKGEVVLYKDKPEIIISTPDDITVR